MRICMCVCLHTALHACYSRAVANYFYTIFIISSSVSYFYNESMNCWTIANSWTCPKWHLLNCLFFWFSCEWMNLLFVMHMIMTINFNLYNYSYHNYYWYCYCLQNTTDIATMTNSTSIYITTTPTTISTNTINTTTFSLHFNGHTTKVGAMCFWYSENTQYAAQHISRHGTFINNNHNVFRWTEKSSI